VRKRWWAAIMIVGAVGLTAAGVFGWKAWRAEWARRHPEAARIARYEKVFDAAWKAVDEHYYDPKFDHVRWRKIRDVYRPHVRDAKNDADLYINMLGHMMRQVGTSHVGVSPPPSLLIQRPAKVAPNRQAKASAETAAPVSETCPGKPLRNDPGFDLASIRRGRGDQLVVANVWRGTAEEHGVAPGDVIKSLTMTNPIRGCPHLFMALVGRGGEVREVAYELQIAPTRAPRARADLSSGVRVLRFDEFDRKSGDWLAENLIGEPPAGVILDLRGNGGGLVSVKTKVAAYFLDEGAALGRSVSRRKTSLGAAPRSPTSYRGPLVVLIGPRSASAAEITAYLLRFHHRAKLIGAETQGAVLTSRSFDLPDGGSVDVAIADYLAPDGHHLEGVGVKPDVPVAQTLEAIRAGRDLPLEAAERALLEGRWRP
jgi:carboxyl-terminal processing protease